MTIVRPSQGSVSLMSLGVLVRSSMFWLMMAALFVTFFGPILWMGTTSLKTYGEATSIPPTLLPSSFDTSAYDTLLSLDGQRSEEHTSELQSRGHLVCRLLLEKKNIYINAL